MSRPTDSPAAGEDAVSVDLRLQVGGYGLQARLSAPVAPVKPQAVLPALQALVDAVVEASLQALQDAGQQASCSTGCAACCRQLVPVSAIEAYRIRDLVDALPAPRRTRVEARFADVSRRVSEAGLYETLMAPTALSAEQRQDVAFAYFALRLDCPFLENELCTIYADRPLVCREYLVTSPPARCAAPADGGISPVNLPRLSRSVLGLGMADDRPTTWPPLALALDWVAGHPDALPLRPGAAWLGAVVDRLEAVQTPTLSPAVPPGPQPTKPVDGADGGITLPMPSGDVTAIAMLPTFRAFTEAVVARAIAESEAQGKPVSCRAGCGACCRHQPVPISTIEARRIAALVDAMPEPRRSAVRARFAAADDRIREWYESVGPASAAARPIVDERYASFFEAGIACPLLEDDSCSIYTERPLVCREYLVTSPAENCARLEEAGVAVEALPRVFAAGALDTLLSDETPPSPSNILLAQALRWTAEHPEQDRPARPAEQWLQRFFQRLGGQPR
ncbi:MAG TPA: YkgJ family cysteine cluster protein [Vineibacter sp.]|nr:YkgJ family cysteine cluster protein [Vineibacter sp.]